MANMLVDGLIIAVSFGMVTVLLKRGYGAGGSPLVAASVVVVTGVAILWSALLVTLGPGRLVAGFSPTVFAIFLAGGFVGTAVGRITMLEGVDTVGASVTSAVVATSPATAFVLGYLVLDQTLSLDATVGIAAVVVGLVLLSLSRGGDIRGWEPRDLLVPVVAPIAFGSAHVIRQYGLITTSTSPLEGAGINEIAAAIGILGYTVAVGREQFADVPRPSYGFFVAAGIAATIGLYTEFHLLTHAEVAIVTALVATQALFAMLFTYLFLTDIERITADMIAAVAVVVLGLYLIGGQAHFHF